MVSALCAALGLVAATAANVQRRIMTLDPDSHAELGEAFVRTPELRAHLDAQGPRLAEYLRDAMVAYAETGMR